MIVKIHLLKGFALDWALAKALGAKKIIYSYKGVWVEDEGFKVGDDSRGWIHHTDPAVCLWLIKEYRASIDQVEHDPKVQVTIWYEITDSDGSDFDAVSALGDTLEQAVARCVVQMRLGDEVDVPEELAGDAAREVVK